MFLVPDGFRSNILTGRSGKPNVMLCLWRRFQMRQGEVDVACFLEPVEHFFGGNKPELILLAEEVFLVAHVDHAFHVWKVDHFTGSFQRIASFLNRSCRPLHFGNEAVGRKREPQFHLFAVELFFEAVNLRIACFLAFAEFHVAVVEEVDHFIFGDPVFGQQLFLFVADHDHAVEDGVFYPVRRQPRTATVLEKEEDEYDADPKSDPVKLKPAKKTFHVLV